MISSPQRWHPRLTAFYVSTDESVNAAYAVDKVFEGFAALAAQ